MENAYKLEFTQDDPGSLYVTCCGLSQTLPEHSFGPAVKPHYMIHFILSGKGQFNISGENYSLQTGCGFLIVPGEPAYYRADQEDPWTYVWVGFGGTQAPKAASLLGLSVDNPVFSSPDTDLIYNIVHEMIEHNTFSLYDVYNRNGQLMLFLSVIARTSHIAGRSKPHSANNYVQKAIEFIRSNYYNPILITDIAAYVCINRSYLYTLFQKEIGISPQKYLTSYRISKATELLQFTSLPIESIALSCGYQDPLVFTKAFHQEKNMSPSAFRHETISDGKRHDRRHLHQVEEFIKTKHAPGEDNA